MCTIAIEALTPLYQTLCIKLHKNIARSRLSCRIAKRSILAPDLLFKNWNGAGVFNLYDKLLVANKPRVEMCLPLKLRGGLSERF